MIEKIDWFKLKGQNSIFGGSYEVRYTSYKIDNISWKLHFFDNKRSFLPVASIKLTIKEKEYIKKIETELIEFEDYELAVKYFNRQKIINNLLNE